MPMMGVFNNLVLFDQHVPQNRVEAIVPDLATSWNSNEEGTELTYSRIRNGDRVQSQLGVAPAEMTERTCGDLEMTPILKEGAPPRRSARRCYHGVGEAQDPLPP